MQRLRAHQQALGIAVLVAAALLAFAVVFDPRVALAEGRDWCLRTFGAGLLVMLALSVYGGWVGSRGMPADPGGVARRMAGSIALGFFAWGALGLNHAHWQLGGVEFAETTLGGDVGRALTDGFVNILAWLSLLVVGLALVAPAAMYWLARNVPLWAEEAWVRRYPHRIGAALQRFLGFAFRHPGGAPAGEGEQVIGHDLPIRARPPLDDAPRTIRPGANATSPLGAGAAVAFGGAVPAIEPEAPSAPLEEEHPEAPEQLGLDLKQRSGWQLAPLELLNAPQISPTRRHDNAARAQLLVDTLSSFGVDASVVEINEGPTVTQFGVEPGWEVRYKEVQLKGEAGHALLTPEGKPRTQRVEVSRTRVRVNRITTLQNDLALALAAPSLRIEAPVPGRAIVGIEVPNDSATVVTMRHVMETPEFEELAKKTHLALALGKGVSGAPVVADLARMPHLLIAGATGSGKSVCMNAIIAGIMMNATPDDVRFVMVDPKRVELTAYSTIPHLAFSEVIVDIDRVVGALQAVVGEMEARFKRFAELAVRNIDTYNRHPHVLRRLPRWVVVIDELADLMMAAPYEVEKLLCRLAQLGRAAGIHLVVATQRPSVDVITGLIKANFPTRIAFAVTSMVDSRTILDGGGAEKLLGKGDMLYLPTDAGKPVRIQGVYVSDAEVERLVEFWTDPRFSTVERETADGLLEEALVAAHGDAVAELDEDDPVVERARQLTVQHSRVSPALLQRRLRVGYLKAVALIDLLAAEGLVGPREEGESRSVLAPSAPSELD